MKRLCACLVMLGLFTVAACNNDKNQPKGGTPPKAPAEKGGQFTLEDPKSISLTQGDGMDYTVTIDRKSDFNQAVTISFTPPDGIKVDPSEKKVMPNEGDKGKAKVTVKFVATERAPQGQQHIKVVAKPEKGDSIEKDIPVEIKPKKK